MKLLASLLSLTVLISAGGAGLGSRAIASEASQPCPAAANSTPGPDSEAAAQADAASLLAQLPLPPGSTESSTEPADDDGLLAHPTGEPATPNAVDVHAWWLLPSMSPVEAVAYVCAHLPAGTTSASFGDGLTGPGVPSNRTATFALPATAGTLATWAVQLPDGSTALRADAQVVWILQRSPAETVPSGARLLQIAVQDGSPNAGPAPQLALLAALPSQVASVSKIEAIVALLNKLPVVQPGVRSCPVSFGRGAQLVFRATTAAAPLAVADITPEACGGVTLTIGGDPQPTLDAGWPLISEIAGVLGVNDAEGAPVGPAPKLSRVRMSFKRFHDRVTTHALPGSALLFRLSAPAEVRVAISRPLRRPRSRQGWRGASATRGAADAGCEREVRVTLLTERREPTGEDRIVFGASAGEHSLAPGHYTAVLRARNADGSSRAVDVTFEVVR